MSKSESGHRWRGNLTWHVTPDIMAYYTYSEGFRPGGFNRTHIASGSTALAAGDGSVLGYGPTQQYARPAGYNSDSLINNEVGFKSEFLDHHVLFNLSAYYMKWENIQQALFDPVHLGNTTFDVNGSSYTIKGFEVQFVARITDGLSVQGSSSVNTPSQSNTPCLTSVGADSKPYKNRKQPDPQGSLHHAGQRCALHESVRPARHSAAVRAAVDVQPACAI